VEPAGVAVLIRPLAVEDVELFRSLRLAALQDSPDAFGETWESARASDWSARTASGAACTDRGVFVALAGEEAVGMVFVRSGTPPAPAFLGGMWVHPQFRRHGVGRALVLRGLAFLRALGQHRVSLWVTEGHSDVLRFYRALGFHESGASASLRAGSSLTITELTCDGLDGGLG
jgi:GNAT superfamily N-acetyltransferase